MDRDCVRFIIVKHRVLGSIDCAASHSLNPRALRSMQTLYLLHLDRHHLGDALFLKSLAQHMAEGKSGEPPCVIVHGSGEKVERTLEAQGYFPERTDGVLEVEDEEQRRLVERAVREMNQEVVGTLTDEVVSAVGIQGVDRELLTTAADGTVQATKVGWLTALIKQRVVPVVSALSRQSGREVNEVWTADALVALAEALQASFDPVACFFTTTEQSGLRGAEGVQSEAGVEAVTSEEVAEPSAVQHVHRAGIPILVTDLPGLFAGERPSGTEIGVPSS